MALDPATLAAIGSTLSGFLGTGQKQPRDFIPQDLWGQQTARLLPETGAETRLAGLQGGLFETLARQIAQQGLPAGLSLASLASGRLPGASMQRIQQQAYGGLQEAGRRISAASQERALAAGVPLSSQQYVQEAELMQPLAAQAGQMSAALQQAELDRLMQMRQAAIANMIAAQQSPALERLLQIRLAQPTQTNLQMTREGGQLPTGLYPEAMQAQQARFQDVLAATRQAAPWLGGQSRALIEQQLRSGLKV